MRSFSLIAALGVTTGLTLAAALPVQAAVIDATFQGPVQSQLNTSYSLDQTLTGSFAYDTVAGQFTSFNVGTFSLPAGATSFVPPPLTRTQSAQFAATAAASASGGETSTSVSVTLQTNGFFNTTDLSSFVQNPGPITTDPNDPNPSTIGYQSQSASGTTTLVLADLSSFSATVNSGGTSVPEPASFAALATGLAGLITVRRRGQARRS